MEDSLPPEVIGYTLTILFAELSLPRQDTSTNLLISAYSIPLVSKQMYTLYQSLSIDWELIVLKWQPLRNRWEKLCHDEKIPEERATFTNMVQTQLYYEALMPLLQQKIQVFCGQHQLSMHEKGYITIDVMKRLPRIPKEVNRAYRGIIKGYEETRKKYHLLYTNLVSLRLALKRKAILKWLRERNL